MSSSSQTEGIFDPRSIPLKTWNDYEVRLSTRRVETSAQPLTPPLRLLQNELWDRESNHSVGSWVPPSKREMMEAGAESLYGRQTLYQAPLARGGSPPVFDRQTVHSPHGSQAGYLPPSASFYGGGAGPQQGFEQPYQDRPYRDNDRATSIYQAAPSQRGGGGGGEQPSDAELEGSVRRILADADLNAVTKKGVRKDLEREWGVDLSGRKDAINRFIEDALLG